MGSRGAIHRVPRWTTHHETASHDFAGNADAEASGRLGEVGKEGRIGEATERSVLGT